MDGRLIDPARTVCLCDVGDTDHAATVAVDANGGESFWLAHKDLLGDDVDHGNENPAHEKLGRLPRAVRERIWGDSLRCGRPRSTNGQPCRRRVKEPGQTCAEHCDGHSCGCKGFHDCGEVSP